MDLIFPISCNLSVTGSRLYYLAINFMAGEFMANLTRITFIVLATLFISACGTVKFGQDFDVGMFSTKVEQNVTTQAQVRSWLGEPTSEGVSLESDGEHYDEWAYYFAEGDLPDMSAAKVKILQIKFDKQGKVRSFNWSTSRQ